MGGYVGETVFVGLAVGLNVGAGVGLVVGLGVGLGEGLVVGLGVGASVGEYEYVGAIVGGQPTVQLPSIPVPSAEHQPPGAEYNAIFIVAGVVVTDNPSAQLKHSNCLAVPEVPGQHLNWYIVHPPVIEPVQVLHDVWAVVI